MQRVHQGVLLASVLLLCWLMMVVVHELGHVVAGKITGGIVTKVVLHPLAISRTDVEPNPRPLIVAWAGPLLGVSLPLLVWGLFAGVQIPGAYLWRFFAGFCLIANGAYIGIGSIKRIGDAGELIRHGAPIWLLWLFGAITVPLGFLLWNRQGVHFGLRESHGRVDLWAAYGSLILCGVVLLLEFVFSPLF